MSSDGTMPGGMRATSALIVLLILLCMALIAASIAGFIAAVRTDLSSLSIVVILFLALGFAVSRFILSVLTVNWLNWSNDPPESGNRLKRPGLFQQAAGGVAEEGDRAIADFRNGKTVDNDIPQPVKVFEVAEFTVRENS